MYIICWVRWFDIIYSIVYIKNINLILVCIFQEADLSIDCYFSIGAVNECFNVCGKFACSIHLYVKCKSDYNLRTSCYNKSIDNKDMIY